MSRPADILNDQAELAANLRYKPELRDLTQRQFTAIFQSPDPAVLADLATAGRLAAPMLHNLVLQIEAAEAYHVSADMSELVVWAASQLDEMDRFDIDQAPVGVGIVRLDKPLPMIDGRGNNMSVNLLVWAPVHLIDNPTRAVVLHLFNSLDEPDFYTQQLLTEYGRTDLINNFGRWMLANSIILFQDARMGPAFLPPDKDPRGMAEIVASGDIPHEFTNLTRIVHSFWNLLNQTIAHVSEERVPRASARRAERAGLIPRVTVVKLRREVESQTACGDMQVEWSHRWYSRGHWGWRVCGQDHPLAQSYDRGWRCRVWIAASIKGPKNKPLIITNNVYSLQR